MLTPLVALTSTTTASAAEATVPAQAEASAAYVTVALTRADSTFKHPGFLMAMDEEGVFVINCEGKDHEITLSFRDVGDTYFTLLIEYAINGHKQWAEKLRVEAGVDKELSKGRSTLTINVDPQGSEDTSREDGDKLDKPKNDEDDPLGGSPLG